MPVSAHHQQSARGCQPQDCAVAFIDRIDSTVWALADVADATAHGNPLFAGGGEREARSKMRAATGLGHSAENHRQVLQTVKTAVTCVLPTYNFAYWVDLQRGDPARYAAEK